MDRLAIRGDEEASYIFLVYIYYLSIRILNLHFRMWYPVAESSSASVFCCVMPCTFIKDMKKCSFEI